MLGTTAFLWAGDSTYEALEPSEPAPVTAGQSGCDFYRSLGKLYSDDSNPVIQSFSLMGRIHAQYGYVDGEDRSGQDFNYDTNEVRRMRIGAKAGLFQYLEVKGQAEIFNDQEPAGGDRGFEFKHMWDLYGKLDLGEAFSVQGLDSFKVGYGKRETHTSAEWDISSNKLKTVERSAISNKVWPSDIEFSNPTGAWVELAQGNWKTEFGLFSTTQEDFIAGWDDGQMYWANFWYDFSEAAGSDLATIYLTGMYQDIDAEDVALASGIEWTTSAALLYGRDNWQFILEGIYGDNGDQSANRDGQFWGVVFIPSMWLIEDRLEAVARYQYQGSEESEGIRLNSRYVRRSGAAEGYSGLSNGRGDEHHSVYGGLKYHLCKDNAHLLAGLEYDNIKSNGDQVYEGWTTFLGFRTFF